MRGGYDAEDVIQIHFPVVFAGYASCVVSLAFCITVVFLPPGTFNDNDGSLRYISDGLNTYCGWSSVFMGPCSTVILVLQLLAATHMQNKSAAGWAFLQALGWNVVVGVQDTGWTVHYIGLALFLVGNIVYNWIASGSESVYGSITYKRINIISILLSLVFFTFAAVCVLFPGLKDAAVLSSFAVAFEFTVLFSIVSENFCLVHALDSFHEIHLRFVPKP